MSCQHPNCSHLIHSICTNHCRWSLCLEHINEHRESLVNEFEQVLEDLIKPTNELSKSIEQTKQSINKDQQNELDHLKQSHENQIKKLEQQLIDINQFQNEYNQISEHSIKIKTNENLLTQNDFQQIDNLLQKINQQKNSLTGLVSSFFLTFLFIHFRY
jgi:DNA anti-recombination protein RmuC